MLKVTCKKCNRKYLIEPSRIPIQGLNVKCGSCGHKFKIKRETLTQETIKSPPKPKGVVRIELTKEKEPPSLKLDIASEKEKKEASLLAPSDSEAKQITLKESEQRRGFYYSATPPKTQEQEKIEEKIEEKKEEVKEAAKEEEKEPSSTPLGISLASQKDIEEPKPQEREKWEVEFDKLSQQVAPPAEEQAPISEKPALTPEIEPELPIGEPSKDVFAPVLLVERLKHKIKEWYQKRKRWEIVTLAGVLVVFIFGLLLGFTRHGIFGRILYRKLFPGQKELQIIRQKINYAKRLETKDTYKDLKTALRAVAMARTLAPYDRELKVFQAYLYFVTLVRYGDISWIKKKALKLADHLDLGNTDKQEELYCAAIYKLYQGHFKSVQKTLELLPPDHPSKSDTLWLLGKTYLEMRMLEQAEKVYRKILKKNPFSPRALFGLAQVLRKRGKLKKAETHLDRLLVRHPHHISAILEKVEITFEIANKTKKTWVPPYDLKRVIFKELKRFVSKKEKAKAYALLGMIHTVHLRPEKAKEMFKRALALNSREELALLGKGELFYRAGEFRKALKYFKEVYQRDPFNIYAGFGAAKAYIAIGSGFSAKRILKEIQRKHRSSELFYLMGMAEEKMGKNQKAERYYRKAIYLSKDYLAPQITLAGLLFKLGRMGEALAFLGRAERRKPDSPSVWILLGQVYFARGDIRAAENAFRRALAWDPTNTKARFGLAITLSERNFFKKAEQAFKKVAKVAPRYPGLAMAQAFLYAARGDGKQARSAYELAAKQDPTNPRLITLQGAVAFANKEYRKAQEYLRQAVELNSNDAEAQHYMGRTLFAWKSFKEALSFLKRAVELNNKRPIYHIYLGWVYDILGDRGRALLEYDRAISLNPKLAIAFLRRGHFKLRLGRAKEGLADLQRALALDPNNAEIFILLGDAYDHLQQSEQAIKYYEAAINRDQTLAVGYYKLGSLLLDIGKEEMGVANLERAIELCGALEKVPPWLPDTYDQLGHAYQRAGKRDLAISAFEQYLRLAPKGSPNIHRVEEILVELRRR